MDFLNLLAHRSQHQILICKQIPSTFRSVDEHFPFFFFFLHLQWFAIDRFEIHLKNFLLTCFFLHKCENLQLFSRMAHTFFLNCCEKKNCFVFLSGLY